MKTVHIYQLSPTAKLFACMRDAQMEAARVWNLCCEIHKQARMDHAKWPGRSDLQKATAGQFALHSQSVQMVVHAFLANIDTTRQLRQTHPQMKMKYHQKPILLLNERKERDDLSTRCYGQLREVLCSKSLLVLHMDLK